VEYVWTGKSFPTLIGLWSEGGGGGKIYISEKQNWEGNKTHLQHKLVLWAMKGKGNGTGQKKRQTGVTGILTM